METRILDLYDVGPGLDDDGETALASLLMLPPDRDEVAAENQRDLDRAGVLMVRLAGPPGAGKTHLLAATAKRLAGALRVGAVVVNPAPDRDVAALRPFCRYVVGIEASVLEPADLREALARVPADSVDVVLVETCGGIAAFPDVGEHLVVAVLGVSGGDDKAAEYKSLVTRASLVILGKTDLRPYVQFDLAAFQNDVRRLNSAAPLLQLSVTSGQGFAEWTEWLQAYVESHRLAYRAGRPEPEPEWFFG